MMRMFWIKIWIGTFFFAAPSAMAMEQQWIEDLNQRFPGIGYEFQAAVEQKLEQYEKKFTVEELIHKLSSDPKFSPLNITNSKTFGLHSELMILYPAIGKYTNALQEAKLLRNFVIKHSPNELKVIQTFRGVYAELLIINNDYEKALQEIEAVIAINPDEAGNYLGKAVIALKKGQFDQAMQLLAWFISKPGAEEYAEQLFVFIMQHRKIFQDAQVQPNTMIDVMLKPQTSPPTHIPIKPETETNSFKPIAETEKKQSSGNTLSELIKLNAEQLSNRLGSPLLEDIGQDVIERDYKYHGKTITFSFNKNNEQIISAQMFFLPTVDERKAFEHIGLQFQKNNDPILKSDILKVWNSYGAFSKVRLSLSEGQVIAIIIEP